MFYSIFSEIRDDHYDLLKLDSNGEPGGTESMYLDVRKEVTPEFIERVFLSTQALWREKWRHAPGFDRDYFTNARHHQESWMFAARQYIYGQSQHPAFTNVSCEETRSLEVEVRWGMWNRFFDLMREDITTELEKRTVDGTVSNQDIKDVTDKWEFGRIVIDWDELAGPVLESL